MTLVECVPNFSEGRRPAVIDQIVAAIAAVDGVHVLDRQSDATHNRCVITFVGPDEAAARAAFGGIAAAVRLIDLNVHDGAHPRFGAADVVPFVPVKEDDMPVCVELARGLAARVGAELDMPAYLYEDAARRPEHRNLADVRRGEFEGLREDILTDPRRAPDEGPRCLHPSAGAVALGARPRSSPTTSTSRATTSNWPARSPSPSASVTAASPRSRPWASRWTTACRCP
jgi:glutamate formiminotransferase